LLEKVNHPDGGEVPHRKGPIAHLHRHGSIKPQELADLVSEAGFELAGKGVLGIWDLQFVLGEAS
jgi:hypothetical protein